MLSVLWYEIIYSYKKISSNIFLSNNVLDDLTGVDTSQFLIKPLEWEGQFMMVYSQLMKHCGM